PRAPPPGGGGPPGPPRGLSGARAARPAPASGPAGWPAPAGGRRPRRPPVPRFGCCAPAGAQVACTDMTDLRIGVLGAARIAPIAIVRPAAQVDGVTVTAVAARDRARAAAFADRHGIGRVLDDYAAAAAHPEIDAL